MKRLAWLGVVVCIGYARPAIAYCPSYTPEQTATTKRCGIPPAPGHNPTVSEWKDAFARIAQGAYDGDAGVKPGSIAKGCSNPSPRVDVAPTFPCPLLQAVTMGESGWHQFCVPDAPTGSVGAAERTLVSFDCGYGISQITSGMHVGERAAFNRERVATDAFYNLSVGTLFLRNKWGITRCVGDRDPAVVENWYSALWAYNGLAYQNNPNNPKMTAGRRPYNPRNGGAYTYQEKIFGWMEHPLTSAHWEPATLAYPDRAEIGGGASPLQVSEPRCAGPTDCSATRPIHRSNCRGADKDAGSHSETLVHDAESPVAAETDAASVAPLPSSSNAPNDVRRDDGGGCDCSLTGKSNPPSRGLFAIAFLLAALATRRARRTRTNLNSRGVDGIRTHV